MELNEILLNNILLLIHEYGVTESSCLTSCNIHNNFLSNLKKGTLKKPCFAHIVTIAKYFDVSIDCLMDINTALAYKENPKYRFRNKDRQIMAKAYEKLDAKGKMIVCEIMYQEQKRMIEEEKYTS